MRARADVPVRCRNPRVCSTLATHPKSHDEIPGRSNATRLGTFRLRRANSPDEEHMRQGGCVVDAIRAAIVLFLDAAASVDRPGRRTRPTLVLLQPAEPTESLRRRRVPLMPPLVRSGSRSITRATRARSDEVLGLSAK